MPIKMVLNDSTRFSSKHSTSLRNSHPFSVDEDGPILSDDGPILLDGETPILSQDDSGAHVRDLSTFDEKDNVPCPFALNDNTKDLNH